MIKFLYPVLLLAFLGCNLKVKRQHKQFTDYEKIRQELLSVLESDQGVRKQLTTTEKKYGYDSKEYKELIGKMQRQDIKNLKKVTSLLDKYGWLGTDYVGDGNAALFLVIQHADLSTQLKYLPMMREAVAKGDARKSSLALLEDRVLMRQGEKQLYGSQISRDEKNNKWIVFPIEDPDNVDKRRAEMGLQPIADYVSFWDIKWDVEKHKKTSVCAD